MLRQQNQHLAADEIAEELYQSYMRRNSFMEHIMQEQGDLEGLARAKAFSKDIEARVPSGTTYRLERDFLATSP